MTSATMSDDCRELKLWEDDQWLHTLTLENKYQARHEWFDLKEQAIGATDTLYKLVPTTPEQREMTQTDRADLSPLQSEYEDQ